MTFQECEMLLNKYHYRFKPSDKRQMSLDSAKLDVSNGCINIERCPTVMGVSSRPVGRISLWRVGCFSINAHLSGRQAMPERIVDIIYKMAKTPIIEREPCLNKAAVQRLIALRGHLHRPQKLTFDYLYIMQWLNDDLLMFYRQGSLPQRSDHQLHHLTPDDIRNAEHHVESQLGAKRNSKAQTSNDSNAALNAVYEHDANIAANSRKKMDEYLPPKDQLKGVQKASSLESSADQPVQSKADDQSQQEYGKGIPGTKIESDDVRGSEARDIVDQHNADQKSDDVRGSKAQSIADEHTDSSQSQSTAPSITSDSQTVNDSDEADDNRYSEHDSDQAKPKESVTSASKSSEDSSKATDVDSKQNSQPSPNPSAASHSDNDNKSASDDLAKDAQSNDKHEQTKLDFKRIHEYAQGHLQTGDLVPLTKNGPDFKHPLHDYDGIISTAYDQLHDAFTADPRFIVTDDGSLILKKGDQLVSDNTILIINTSDPVDYAKAIGSIKKSGMFHAHYSKGYNPRNLPMNDLLDQYIVTDGFIDYLASLPSWKHIANGKFDDEMTKLTSVH